MHILSKSIHSIIIVIVFFVFFTYIFFFSDALFCSFKLISYMKGCDWNFPTYLSVTLLLYSRTGNHPTYTQAKIKDFALYSSVCTVCELASCFFFWSKIKRNEKIVAPWCCKLIGKNLWKVLTKNSYCIEI